MPRPPADPPKCHPDRKHYANGQCKSCYEMDRRRAHDDGRDLGTKRCAWGRDGQACRNEALPGKLCCDAHQPQLEAIGR